MVREQYSRRSALGLAGGALGALAAVALGRRLPAASATASLIQDGTPTDADGIEHPTEADAAVIRIEHVGGFTLPEVTVTQLPLTALYGDGLLVTQGPQIAIFPPPALPNLRQVRLTEEGVQAILAEAEAAGLIGQSRRYENPQLADAPYTVISVQAAGTTTRVAVYALGTDNPEWTAEERAAVQAIQAFTGLFFDVTSWLPATAIASGDEDFPIARLQVLAEPYALAGIDPGQPQPPVDWPLTTPLAAFDSFAEQLPGVAGATCGVVTGDDATVLAAAAAGANSLTPWVSEGEEWLLWLRPLLPDETGCPPREPDLDILPAPEGTPAA